jgi:hypothetical protein
MDQRLVEKGKAVVPQAIDSRRTCHERHHALVHLQQANRFVKGICPRGNNKVVIIIFHVYDKCLFLMLELY